MTEVIDLLIRSIPIIIGAGTVQFIIWWLRRRGAVRTAEAVVLRTQRLKEEAAAEVVHQAAQDATDEQIRDHIGALDRANDLLTQLEHAEEQVQSLRCAAREMHTEINRLRTEITTCKVEIARLNAP